MITPKGNIVANQFIITEYDHSSVGNFTERQTFQSYNNIIAIITLWPDSLHSLPKIELDRDKWDYSVKTDKYRNQFLDETKKETQAKIDSGEYILTDLNFCDSKSI